MRGKVPFSIWSVLMLALQTFSEFGKTEVMTFPTFTLDPNSRNRPSVMARFRDNPDADVEAGNWRRNTLFGHVPSGMRTSTYADSPDSETGGRWADV